MKKFKLVALESPYASPNAEDVETHEKYARFCMADCLKRGEAPFASHLLYTQPGVLDATKPGELKLGIEAGFAIKECLEATVVYVDYGISSGMIEGILRAQKLNRPVIFRSLQEIFKEREFL